MIFSKKQKGETLIEVITALTALVLAGMASVTVIISVMHSNAISKEYLIAQNLAREGIEGVISIRNTNWLKYPSDKKNCWLALDPGDCGTKVVDNGTYILEMGTGSSGFKLTNKGTNALDLTATGGEDNATNAGFIMKVEADTGLYKQGENVTETTEPHKPNFYRMIKFEQVDVEDLNKFKVTVTMQWFTKSQVNTYELTSIITNYAK